MKAKKTSKTLVHALVCAECKDILYSRARHDFRECTCGGIFVDGGFDYMRCGGADIKKAKHKKMYVKANKDELYDDWNTGRDEFGLIENEPGK